MRRSVKYGLYGAVLAGLVGGTVAWATVDKTVTLRVDGQQDKVHTTAATVRGALSDAGYTIRPHDLVAPAANSHVHNGSIVVLKRGRLLHLSVDGVQRDIWVTTPTVGDALAQLGYSTTDFASVSRAKRLPLTPTDIDIRTPKQVTVVHDGTTQTVQTTDATVSQLMSDLGVHLGKLDRSSVPWSAKINDGLKITIKRVRKTRSTKDQPIPFPTTKQQDDTLAAGQTVVVRDGKAGLVRITYELVYVDGKLAGKTQLSKKTVAQPVPKVVKVGTKQAPPPPPPPPANSNPAPAPISVDPGSAQAIAQQMVAARGWGSDQFNCLVQIWDRESGWRVNAENPSSGAYGIPQALPGSKMAAFGADWQTNPHTQIAWGLSYIAGRYGTPCGAWGFWQANNWY